jgi:hypothetical protein
MRGNEQRLRVLEEMVTEIHAVLVMGKTPAPPGAVEYKRALEAMTEGDMAPMTSYLRRGGEVLKAETIYPEAAMQRGRKGKPTAGRQTPVQALRGLDKGAKELRQG